MSGSAIHRIDAHSAARNYLARCWRQRGLLWFFARRDLVVRYRQTLLGVAWVLLRPVLGMGVLGFLFGTVAGLPAAGLPYPLVVLVGMMAWQYFSAVLNEGTGCIANNPSLVTKVSFPRLLMPAASLVLNLVDMAVIFLLVLGLMAWHHVIPPPQILLLPVGVVMLATGAMGTACFASALAVRYRDMRSLVPVAVQYGMLLSPVAYLTDRLPDPWHWLVWMNPLTGPIEWFRWCLLPGLPMPPLAMLQISGAMSVTLLVGGYRYFRRSEGRFADVI